jgi:peptide/nickel transport system ATP-binding protein
MAEALPDLLRVEDLHVEFRSPACVVHAVKGANFRVRPGSTVAIVGESGSGKSVISQAIMGILPRVGRIAQGRILFADPRTPETVVDIAQLPADGPELRAIRGGRISIIFQEPMTSLSPVHTVGNQVGEALRLHRDVGTAEARDLTSEMLRLVGFPDPSKALKTYPFELSGGLRQRAMIAMALVCTPALLIADEPTTALDVTIQAQILDLIKELQRTEHLSILLITHDLGVVAETVQNVAVMYAGRVVESGPVEDVLLRPQHPYTLGLLNSIPALHKRGRQLDVIKGVVPNPFRMPPGCKFAPRCPFAWDRCVQAEPNLVAVPGRSVLSRCYLHAADSASRRLEYDHAVVATVAGGAT